MRQYVNSAIQESKKEFGITVCDSWRFLLITETNNRSGFSMVSRENANPYIYLRIISVSWKLSHYDSFKLWLSHNAAGNQIVAWIYSRR